MHKGLVIYLIIIFLTSLSLFLICNKKYKFKVWLLIVYAFLLTIIGALSTTVLAYFESGNYGGTSYYGAVFLLPLFLLLISKIFKLKKTSYLFDLMAIVGSVTLVIMKVRCYIEGCCTGRIIAYHNDLSPIMFPSQIVEGINGLLILSLLLYFIYKGKYKGKLYLIFMIVYGITRFILSYFRFYVPVFLNLSFGHIWSILSITISLTILFYNKRKIKVEKVKK